jgi:hypothetical protein
MGLTPSVKGKLMSLDMEGVREAFALLRARQDLLAKELKKSFKVGDLVWFDSKHGRVEGKVVKLLKKNVSVDSTNGLGNWRVYPGNLNPMEEQVSE